MEPVQIAFKHPTTMLMAGPTGCGKTQFLLKLIRHRAFQPPPQRIVCVYGEWQSAYDELRRIASESGTRLEFIQNPDAEQMTDLYESFTTATRNLLILDDQMANAQVSRRSQGGGSLTKLFAQGSHHRNLSIIYIVQNVFNQSPEMLNVRLNSDCLVLFKTLDATPHQPTTGDTTGAVPAPGIPSTVPKARRWYRFVFRSAELPTVPDEPKKSRKRPKSKPQKKEKRPTPAWLLAVTSNGALAD